MKPITSPIMHECGLEATVNIGQFATLGTDQ